MEDCVKDEDMKRCCLYQEDNRSRTDGKLECGPMLNVMVALPNIGGALCSTPQSLADANYLTAMQ